MMVLPIVMLDGIRSRLIDKLARVQLLILDDWGTHTMNDSQRLDILDICEERYGRPRTSWMTSMLPPRSCQWVAAECRSEWKL